MDEYFDRTLVEDFPTLYRQRYLNEYQSPMYFGFECGDGWEPLIRDLSRRLDFLNEVAPVWIEAAQVKEKYSTLRFYVDIREGSKPWRDIIYNLIWSAETRSSYTCEWCGEHGSHRNDNGWLRTLCEPCHEKFLSDRVRRCNALLHCRPPAHQLEGR